MMDVWVPTPLDDEQVISCAQAAIGVGQNLLNQLGGKACDQAELKELATEAAEVLHSLLSWMPEPTDRELRLLGALYVWLP